MENKDIQDIKAIIEQIMAGNMVIKNNPFQAIPEKEIKKALNVIEEFSEEFDLD